MGAAVLLLSFWLLRRELAGLSWVQIRTDLRQIRPPALGAALLLTAANYVVLTGYDALGLRYASVHLERWKVATAGMIGYAFAQGLGFPFFTGASVRYRLYSSWGISALDIARVVAFYTSSFWVGFAAVAGTAFVLTPVEIPSFVPLPGGSLRVVGGVLLAALVVVGGWSVSGRGQIRLGPLDLPVPRPPVVAAQIGLGLMDWLLASLVLWVVLPDGHVLGFGAFFSTFLLAQSAGTISHVPGGLGVFEAVFLSFLPHGPAHPRILASLLAFRLIYYLVPLFSAAVALSIRELRMHGGTLAPPALRAARAVSQLVPGASAAVTFVLGGVLVLSGSIPLPADRLEVLDKVLPLPLLEASHFLGSVVGVGLLVLARGLQRRLDGAYHLTVGFLLLGALLALTRDLHVAAAFVFLVGAGALWASRAQFYRPASLLDEPFSPSWVLAIFAVVATSVWLGLFAFQHVEYSTDLWWRFALREDAPRFLRASVGAAMGLAVFVAARLLRPAQAAPAPADEEILKKITPLVEASSATQANLVFLRDKEVLLSETGRSFLMFSVSGSSWIVLGDPIGDPSEFEELAWRLMERADHAGGEVVFYEVGSTWLPLYIDLGLVFFKLGEEARVPLTDFTLEGKARADLRHAMRRLQREGASFEVVPASRVPPLLSRLREISDEWLGTRAVREKRFSLGRFQEDYVRRFPCAVIRVDDTVVAFASLWTSTSKYELSVDLMRYASDAPKSVMDGLFAHLLVWGSEQGYLWFSLGMAPFSGMETHRLAPSWQKLGSALYRYGEHFYNFQGLRDYKEKFNPVWEPRYLAAPPGIRVAKILADVASLVSGGLKGVVLR